MSKNFDIPKISILFFTSLVSFFIFFVSLRNSDVALAQNESKNHLFKNPLGIRIDTKNNLIYVLNKLGITILDAKDYSLVTKLFGDWRISNIYLDSETGKVYAVDNSNNQLLIFKALSKEELKNKTSKDVLGGATIFKTGKGSNEVFINHRKKIIYVLVAADKKISVIDFSSSKAEAKEDIKINTEIDPSAFLPIYSERQNKIYFIGQRGGKLWVLDLENKKLNSIKNAVGLFYLTANEKTDELYASDNQNGTLRVIDMSGDRISSTISLNKLPSRVFYDQTLNKILVLSWQTDDLTIIDPVFKKVEKVISLGTGADPTYFIFNPQVNQLFIMNGGANTTSLIDVNSWEIIKTIETPANPSAPPEFNSVRGDIILPMPWSHINALFLIQPDYKTKLIPEGGDSLVSESDFFQFPIFIAAHPTKRDIYILSNIGGEGGKSKITAIDGKSNEVLWMTSTGMNSREIVLDSLRGKLYINNADENTISVIDASNGKPIKLISVGLKPRTLVIDEKRGKVFVANSRGNSISIIDTSSDSVEQNINTGQQEPYQLFYDSYHQLLYVLGADRSLVTLDKNNKVIYTLKLPLEGGHILEHFIQPSSDFSKIYVMTVGGGIYRVEGGSLKIIREPKIGTNWSDIVNNGQAGKFYIGGQTKKVIAIFDPQREILRDFVKLNYIPYRLVFANQKLFVFNKEGILNIVNQDGMMEGTIFLGQFPEYVAFSSVNQKIYIAYPRYNSIGVFDVSQNKLVDVLKNDTTKMKSFSWKKKSNIIYLAIGLLTLIGIIISLTLFKKRIPNLNKIS